MTLGGIGITRSGRGRHHAFAYALAVMLVLELPAVVSAQMFTDRPPPVPPAEVPEPGGAMSLAPPPAPNLPAPVTQPPVAAIPPVIASPGTSTAGQAVLSLTARYG